MAYLHSTVLGLSLSCTFLYFSLSVSVFLLRHLCLFPLLPRSPIKGPSFGACRQALQFCTEVTPARCWPRSNHLDSHDGVTWRHPEFHAIWTSVSPIPTFSSLSPSSLFLVLSCHPGQQAGGKGECSCSPRWVQFLTPTVSRSSAFLQGR